MRRRGRPSERTLANEQGRGALGSASGTPLRGPLAPRATTNGGIIPGAIQWPNSLFPNDMSAWLLECLAPADLAVIGKDDVTVVTVGQAVRMGGVRRAAEVCPAPHASTIGRCFPWRG